MDIRAERDGGRNIRLVRSCTRRSRRERHVPAHPRRAASPRSFARSIRIAVAAANEATSTVDDSYSSEDSSDENRSSDDSSPRGETRRGDRRPENDAARWIPRRRRRRCVADERSSKLERDATLDRSTARARRIDAATAAAAEGGGHLATISSHARRGIEPTTSEGTGVLNPKPPRVSRRTPSGSNSRVRRAHASAATCAAASKTIASENRANRDATRAIRDATRFGPLGPNAVASADASVTAVAIASATMVRTRRAVARTRLARARMASSRSRVLLCGRASSGAVASFGFANVSTVREGATANDSPTESSLFARTRIHRAVRRGARVRGVVDSRRPRCRSSSASSTATRRHPPPPPRSLHSASAMDTDASANEPCVRTANAAENAARARRTRARLVAARHVLVASRSLARSRRDARSFDARADARRRVQTRRDARSVATGRSRIRNDVGVASMTRCAEVTGVDVASTAAVVLGCPGWIVRGAYPACGSPRRPHPACGSPRRPRSACGSPRRRDGAGAIFPSMDETTPRPSPIGEGRVRAARRASSSEKASRDAGRGVRGRTRAEACATTSPVGNAKKCREAIACVGEGGGWDVWTPQGLVARGRGVSEKTGISIPRGRGRSRRTRGRTRGLARSRRGISRESSSARDRVSANMSSARAAFAGQRASDREPDRVPLGVFFCFRRCRDARDECDRQACANSSPSSPSASPRGGFDEQKRSIWGI